MLPLIQHETKVGNLQVAVTTDARLVKTLINEWHSMRPAPAGWKVAFVLTDGINIYGVSTFGRPVARNEDQSGATLEHTRMATAPYAPKNSASYFMARCRKWIRKNIPEVTRLISYIPTDLYSGVTYVSDNWPIVYEGQPERSSWQTRANRAGIANKLRTKFERVP